MARIIKPLILSTFLLVLSACSTTAETSAPDPTELPQETLAPSEPIDQERYFNQQGSFSLILPQDWQVSGPIDAAGGGGLTFSLYKLGLDPETSGGPGTSSIAISDQNTMTIEEFVQGQCSTCPPAPIEEIQLEGVRARQTVIGGGGVPIEVTWTFIEHNGKLISLAIHDPETLEPLDKVLNSIQLH
jgi:hypothetical protein